MEWVPDNETYIQTGRSNQMVTSNSSFGYNRALAAFRYFPNGRSKNCYELPTTRNATYLIRVGFFLIKSVWNERQPFQFILSVDATNWFTLTSGIDTPDPRYFVASQEGIFHAADKVMQLCLQPVVGEPFVTSLELRKLPPTMYYYSGSYLQYLSLVFRYNIGAKESSGLVR